MARLWPALVNTKVQCGPRLGSAEHDILGCKCLAEWDAGVEAKCCCGGYLFSFLLPLKEWIPVSVRAAVQSWAVKGCMNVTVTKAKFLLLQYSISCNSTWESCSEECVVGKHGVTQDSLKYLKIRDGLKIGSLRFYVTLKFLLALTFKTEIYICIQWIILFLSRYFSRWGSWF